MNRTFVSVLRMVYPRRCIYCDRVTDPDVLCCPYCAPDIPFMEDPVCPYCGRTKSLCNCGHRRHHFDRCVAAMRYEDGAAHAVLRLKKDDNADYLETMAHEMVHALRTHCDAASVDVVTCIPMIQSEEYKRQFNQSEELAKEVASQLGVPFRRTLKKLYKTQSQKSLTKIERSGNLLGVFDCIADVKGQHVLLVDDLITTGATLHECAKMLKIAQAQTVTALVFAATISQQNT